MANGDKQSIDSILQISHIYIYSDLIVHIGQIVLIYCINIDNVI